MNAVSIKRGLALSLMLDIFGTLLVTIIQSGSLDPATWGSPIDFHSKSTDLVVLSLLRVGFTVFSIFLGRQYIAKAVDVSRDQQSSSLVEDDFQEDSAMLTSRSTLTVSTKDLAASKFSSEFVAERRRSLLRRKATRVKHALVVGSFLLATGCNIYTAVKGLSFIFHGKVEEICICVVVFLTNLEAALISKCLNHAVDMNDAEVSELHTHPLRFNHEVIATKCSLCNFRIIKEGFDCPKCDFNVCLECFRKKTKSHSENNLYRSDKGTASEPTEPLSTLQYMRKAVGLAKPFAHLIALTFSCLIVNQIASVLSPNYQGKVIDSVIKQDAIGFSRSIKVYIGLSIVTLAVGSVKAFSIQLIQRNVNNHVRTEVFACLLKRDIAFFDGSTTGSLTSRITQDVRAMVSPLSTLINTVIGNSLTLVGGFAMCMHVSWRLSLVALTVVGPIVHITGVYAEWSRRINRRIWDSLAEGNNVATQAFGNIRTVKAFSSEDLEIKKYNQNMDDVLKTGIKDAMANGGSFFVTSLLDLLAMGLILGLGGAMVMRSNGTLTVGELITFQLYANMMNGAYKSLNGVLNTFTKAAGAADRVFAMLEAQPGIGTDGKLRLAEFQGEMELRNVDFSYQMRPKKRVLSSFSALFERNQVTAMVGKSGGGKSTVMHLLLRFYDPINGQVLCDGHPLPELDLEWLHSNTAVVSQETQLFAATIEQNITYGVDNYTKEELLSAVTFANARDFIEGFDDGFQTTVGERGTRLSGGQKQRIAIARAFLRKPKLLILDEATSALDSESEAQVQEALDKLMDGLGTSCTIVVVAHRLSTVVKANKILVLDEGRVVEQGTHDELLGKDGSYASLIKHQISGLQEPAARPNKDLMRNRNE